MVYKANRFLNLAHAQLGALAALLLAKFVNDLGWNFWVAAAVCLPLGVLTGLGVERFLVRPVRARTSSPVRLLILTVGISQLLLALTYVPAFAPDRNKNGSAFPQPFSSQLEIGGVVLSGMAVLTLIVVPVLLAILTGFLGFSSIGKQIRAAASNPQEARLVGISIDRVSLITWGVAGGLSAVSAVLNGPSTSTFNAAAVGPNLLLLTMGAAAFGAFVSLPWAVGGGVALGVTYQVVAGVTHKAGTALLSVFVVILVVILLRGKAIEKVFAITGSAAPERPAVRVPAALRSTAMGRYYFRYLAAGALLVAAAAPRLPGLTSEGNRFLLVMLVIYALIGIALTMLIGWAGQVSLGHFALVGLGAFLTAKWAPDGWTVLGLLTVIGLIGAAATVVVGLPAIRVRGLTLVVTTLGFAVICPQYLYLQKWVGGDTPFTTPVQRPEIGAGLGPIESQISLYYLALLLLVLVVASASALRRSTAGRTILAVRDNERASAAFGVAPATVKLAILALSGSIVAMVGVLWAVAWQRVTPEQFGPEVSMAVLAIPVIGGLGSISGAIAATVLLYVPTLFLAPHLTPFLGDFGKNIGFLLLLAGLGVIVTMRQFPNGVAGQAATLWQKHLDRRAEVLVEASPGGEAALPLVLKDVTVRFGGVVALDGAAIEVRPGEILGLIGGNGAGKTTLMNVISGIVQPQAGSVRVFGHEVVDLPPDVRAGYGVARSFQDASLFAGLTVLETVQLAVAQKGKSGMLGALAGAPWSRTFNRESRKRAEEIVASFGLEPWADSLTGSLSTGTRRICDLAAQVAAGPKLLMLDEPTAGVAQRDAEAFGPLVRRIRDELDCAIVIIEHDMPLLMGLCDRVYALEAGRVIAEGTPEEVRNDPRVIGSYLGTDTTAIDRSTRTPSTAPTLRPRAARKTKTAGGTTVTTLGSPS